MSRLLYEIGCEELPAKVCGVILRQLGGDDGEEGLVQRLLAEHRLLPEGGGAVARVLVSPRRIAVLVDGVPEEQTARVHTFRGPRADVAFDAEGQPTRAGLGFARSRGVPPEHLRREVVDGTEFAVAVVEAERRATIDELPAFCVELLKAIQVPRGMRWGARPPGADEYLRFSRPIRWLVCKLGRRTVRFSFYDLECGDVSQGHRVLGAPAAVGDAADYERLLEQNGVVVDHERRRQLILNGLDAAADDGDWFDPGDVLEEAVYLVEWPTVHRGSFPTGKLRLPADVLITAMQSHQRYFPLRERQAALLPAFLYVSNADPAHAAVITHGNERVLDGRLDDAEFAYDRDLAEGLPAMAGRLHSVVFHEKLGSLADKTERLERLAAWLADQHGDTALAEVAGHAASLAKADLVSQVVIEFPLLQGTMGGIYAAAAGLLPAEAAAIGEHYLPLSATAPPPATLAGGVLAIADKIDNIAGAWVAGEKPSGSRDPYGLRRAAMGIVRICLQSALRIDVTALIGEALQGYADQGLAFDRAAVVAEVRAFIWERLEGLLLDEGVPYDAVGAALGSSAGDVPGVAARARTFATLQRSAVFLDAVTAYNRCASLAAKAAGAVSPAAVDSRLFRLPAETVLYEAWHGAVRWVEDALGDLDLVGAIGAAAALRPTVDAYFDEVLVMDEDAAVRGNRLAQLAGVTALVRQIGDFSQLAV